VDDRIEATASPPRLGKDKIMAIPNKAEWQKIKGEFGIPDGASKIKMGDAFGQWKESEKALLAKEDFQGCVTGLGKLDTSVKAYKPDLARIVPDKFKKGKDLSEKHKNHDAAVKKVEGIIKEVGALAEHYKTLATKKAARDKDLAAIDAITMQTVVGNSGLGDKFAAFTHDEEKFAFLRKTSFNRGTYDEFIKNDDVNMDQAKDLRKAFLKMAEDEGKGVKVDWTKAPWGKAQEYVRNMLVADGTKLPAFKELLKKARRASS
jgi:hypothetical protein